MTRSIAQVASIVALVAGIASTSVRAQSALDGFNPGANDSVWTVALQPDGKVLVGGSFTMLGGGGTGTTPRSRIARLNPDGSLDATFDPGANDTVNTLAVQPDGKILVGGLFTMLGGGGTGTTPRSRIARLNPDGSLDATFNPGANDTVQALVVQPDGKILVGGRFTGVGSGTGSTPRSRIARLNADGSLDPTFNPGASFIVYKLTLQPDGKILVGGVFTALGGGSRYNIGRLNADGSLDMSFNPGAGNTVVDLAVQPDGKILVGGAFMALGGGGTGTTARSRIGRLNPDGSLDTTFNPGANSPVRTFVVQADGKILVSGDFTLLGGGAGTTPRSRIGRLNPDGSVDLGFNPGANSSVFAMAEQPDGMILVSGYFTALGGGTGTTPRSKIGRLHPDGTIDADLNPVANDSVKALAVQPDGKILAGGFFTALGVSGTTTRHQICRLNPDGSVDATFDPGANGSVNSFAVQPDGKILVGGNFTMLGGGGAGTTPRNRIGRLNPNGSLDTSFNPGANSNVLTVAVQPDGKILVGGEFTMLGGGVTGTTARSFIGRLNADGSLDPSFDPGAGNVVATLVVQPDGKILVGGWFGTLGGGTGTTVRNRIGRLNSDGSVDTSFDPGADGTVDFFAVQPDGKILVSGWFTTLGGGETGTTERRNIGRLHADGSLDLSFNPGASDRVLAMAVQPDGKILLGGYFTTLGGGGRGTTARSRIGRLNADGSVDTLFDPGASQVVETITVQPDGKILVGGWFTMLGGGGTGTTPRSYIGRLTNTAAVFQRLSASCPGCVPNVSGVVQSQVTWARSGAGPEVERVTFEVSPDGVTYDPPANATRTAGGWQAPLTGFSNSNWLIRARGYYRTDWSSSIVESIRQLYVACPTVAPTSLPVGATGYPYSATFTAPGALGVVTFGVTATLPAGLTLSSAGTLSGTPTQAGTFPLTVTATDLSSGCAGSETVTLSIAAAPILTLDKTSLRFGAVTTGAAFVWQTAAQIVRLRQSGPGTATWTATPNQPWLQVSPASGSGSADLSITVVAVPGLPIGNAIAGAITLTVTGAFAPGPITVTLDLIPHGLSALPFGVVDTPLENTTGVTGAVPFTGWALDDIEVTRVVVCRAAVGGEGASANPNCGGAAQIFLGVAVFIDGARPDVAAYFPTYPLHTRGGWGFMVLTNMLPNQGNGTYQFAMYAEDREGRAALLGTRTMTCANASATKPFGAIDTPTQGGLASGSSFVNFGWALTPQPKLIPLDGSTISVWVDGMPIGTVDYNHERADIETLFPGFQNTTGPNGGVGFRILDTTTLTNGLHTISWTVVDDHGAVEGIGSRFFTVSNGAAALTEADARSSVTRALDAAEVRAIDLAPLEGKAFVGRRGWDPSVAQQTFAPGASGRIVIRSEEVSRVELVLGAVDGARYTGYLRTSEGLAPLPIGSQLNTTTGVFTWAPGVGFVGPYDLVFARWAGAQAVARQEVRIILAPKSSGAVGPQVVIDAPRSQQDVAQPFVLGGWAADLTATSGTGIAAVHAWAYPLAGGPPVFLGAASYGGARPDVAAVHGDEFRDSGFGLMVQGLAHGHYDLAVFAWSTEAADFVPATVVRVTVR